MKTQMLHPSIHFYCRKSRANKKGYATIEMFVKIGEERKGIPLEMQYKPEEFERDLQKKKGNALKEYVNTAREKAMVIMTDMRRKNIPVTMDNFFNYWVEGGVDKVYTLDELFSEYLELRKQEYEAKQMTKITYTRYKSCQGLFYEACGLKGSESVQSISIKHWQMFEAALLKKQKPSYACGWLKKIKSVFNYAFQTGKIDSNPFYNVKIDRGSSVITYLTEEELDIIKKKVFKSDRLNRIKDVFLFQCFTALSYADLKGLVREDFKQNKDKQWYIKKRRQKTGSEFVVVLLPNALEIVMEYNFCLPVISLTNYNKYLKEIGEICEIDKPFTTHLARRTGACYLLNAGVPVEVVAKTLGDSVKMVRQHYATLFDTTVFEEMKEVEEAQLSKLLGELLV